MDCCKELCHASAIFGQNRENRLRLTPDLGIADAADSAIHTGPKKRPDAILVEPVDTGMHQVAKAAVSAGIAWVLINAGVDSLPELRLHSTVPVFSVISDHKAIGKIQGQHISALLGDIGTVLYIEGPGIRDVSRLRTQGMMSTKPPGIMIKTLKGDWTQQSGFDAIKSWLSLSTSRQMHIGMIACQNDDMAMGARHAFEELSAAQEREAWLALPITGCDGGPQSRTSMGPTEKAERDYLFASFDRGRMKLLASSRLKGTQPQERTLVAPISFPALAELKRVSKAAPIGSMEPKAQLASLRCRMKIGYSP